MASQDSAPQKASGNPEFSPRARSQSTLSMLMGASGNPGPPPPSVPPQFPAEDGWLSKDESDSGDEAFSDESVRYSTGQIQFEQVDLESDGFGMDWGHSRSYSNALQNNGGGTNGNNWFIKQIPRLYLDEASDQAASVGDISRSIWFKQTGVTFSPQFPLKVGLEDRTSQADFSYSDAEGVKTLYFDSGVLKGRFKGMVDAKGHQYLAHYNGSNQLDYFEMGGSGQTARYEYAYVASGVNAGQLSSVTYKVSGVNVRRCVYEYYGTSDAKGSVNDLKTAQVETYDAGTTSWTAIKKSYYRYYKAGDTHGFASGLKYVVLPETYARMLAESPSLDPIDATDEQLDSRADFHYKYDTNQRVAEQTVNAGTETRQFAYTASSFSQGYNNWAVKTVETLPDTNQNIVYSNFAGSPMLTIRTDGTDEWYQYWRYDESTGVATLQAESSAVGEVNDLTAGIVTLDETSGLIHVFDYFDNPLDTGYAPGYLKAEKVKCGSTGSPTKVRELQYVARIVGSYTIYPISKEIAYRSDASGGSQPAETSYAFEWFTDSFQMSQKTTTWPVIVTAENGSNTAPSKIEVFDEYGRVTWLKDERGIITYTPQDLVTGALSQQVDDVDTSITGGAPSGWSSTGGLNLITDYEFDLLGRHTQELGPTHEIDLAGTATSIRSAKWTVYRDDIDQEWEGLGYASGSAPSYTYTLINPVSQTWTDKADRVTDEIKAVRTSGSGKLTASDSFPQSSRKRWKQSAYDNYGNLISERVYFDIPSSGPGSEGTNYKEVTTIYDSMNRVVRAKSPAGTIARTVYNPQDWVMSTWIGTDDTGASNTNPAGSGGANNMKQIVANVYDENIAGGDGNLTQTTQYADASGTRDRITTYGYDFRNRKTSTDGEIDFYEKYTYDNLDRVVQTDRKNTTSGGNFISRVSTSYDALGRVYRATTYAVDPATGDVGNALTSNEWYDPSGNVIKAQQAGSQLFQKTIYDGIDRKIVEYTAYDLSETAYPYPIDVSTNTVMQQAERSYDTSDNLASQIIRERFHNASDLGPLTSPIDSQPKARVSYVAFWADALGRTIASADYGTNGASDWIRPDTVPERSVTILVTTSAYNDRGEAYLITDPLNTISQSIFDDAGRRVRLIENYIFSGTDPDENRQTGYTYHANDQLATLTATNATTGDQVTQYIYGTTLNDSDIASNELLRQKISPDDTVGTPDRTTFAYNRLSQSKQMTDPNGTVHDYDYDKLGRIVQDCVTTLGTGVDGAVRRIGRTYEVRGLLEKVTSYDDATVGNVVNEVQLVYNSFMQVVTSYQAHSGAVNTSTTPKVQYAYADGSANTIRPTSLTYPNSRVVAYEYDSSGSMADALSRISAFSESSSPRVSYTYLGLGATVRIEYAEPDVEMTYIDEEASGDGGDQYVGLDRFGRVVDVRWVKEEEISVDIERVQYGYDEASNLKWRQNPVAGSGQDQYYANDGLYQIKTLDQGTLNGSKTGIEDTPSWEEDFTYDPVGNWDSYLTKIDGSINLDQGREHNKANKITAIDSSSDSIGYDVAGNMTFVPKVDDWNKAWTATWDAWNRLVKLEYEDEIEDLTYVYAYDGTNRRVIKYDGSSTRHYYYSEKWQILEERIDSSSIADRQFIWGIGDKDDLVLRDDASQRLYGLRDMLSITALTDAYGAVVERYSYNAFGKPNIMDADFAPLGSSGFDWDIYFCEYKWDAETEFYQVRNRYLHSVIGRWLSKDLLLNAEIADGANLYSYVTNSPTNSSDELGLRKRGHRRKKGQIRKKGGKGHRKLKLTNLTYEQKQVVRQMAQDAFKFAKIAYKYLSSLDIKEARHKKGALYRKWFGRPTKNRLKLVTEKFKLIVEILRDEKIEVVGKGWKPNSPGTAAETTGGGTLRIWLRPLVWEMPDNSDFYGPQSLVFLHEIAHEAAETVTAWTRTKLNDYRDIADRNVVNSRGGKPVAYGVSNAQLLAQIYPNRAILNASNYELFAADAARLQLPNHP